MQTTPVLLALFLAVAPAAQAVDSNPLSKVMEMIDELSAKIIKEGEAEAKAFKEYFEWCDDVAKNGANDIKTGTDTKAKLEAKIDKLAAEIEGCDTNIEKLVASIATDSKELEEATAAGRNVDRLKEAYENARNKLTEAEPVFHTFSIDRILPLVHEADDFLREARQEIRNFQIGRAHV